MRIAMARVLLPGLVLCSLLPGVSTAAVAPQDTPVRQKIFRNPDLHVKERQEKVGEMAAAVAGGLTQELAAMGLPPEQGYYDSRAGRWSSLVLSEPLIPGTGLGNTLRWSDLGAGRPADESAMKEQVWSAVRGFLSRHEDQLRVDLSELEATPRVGIHEEGGLVFVYARRMAEGIPVRDSSVTAVINHGNLILLGIQNWADMKAPLGASIPAAQAREALAAHVAPFTVARYAKEPYLELIPMMSGESVDYRLAWVVKASVADDQGSWEGLIDARSGELLMFDDMNQYAARQVMGGVYPVSNDQRPPDGQEQAGWPMPYTNVVVGGNTSFTNSGGVLGCAVGNIQTTLSGRYVRMVDGCGLANENAAAGNLDLGFGPTAAATDCTVPVGHSVGDTKASRSGMYELNRIIEQAKGYLPTNTWLHSQLPANMNIINSCNAFWNGASVNFYRDSVNCRNTGEIAAIFDHEWGHGMDNNGVNPNIAGPGESIADIHALIRLNTSCIGRGFFKNQVCGGYGDGCDGTPADGCTGVRDIEFLNHRCNLPHTITWALSGFTTAQCPGGAPACPAGAGTPCGKATHCEGHIAGEATWDLMTRDLRQPPFSLDENTAMELTARLAFLGTQTITAWYTCTVGGGCGATNGYLLYLAADDDDGSLTNGTPHMTAIRNAFERHEIHCTTQTPTNFGCASGPTGQPSLTVTPIDQGASLSWTSVPNAARYYIYRTEGVAGCSFGKVKVGETTGTTFFDEGLQNGRQYYYSVWPVGSNLSCFGLMSACQTVTPAAGANMRVLEATTVTQASGDGDAFLDNCEVATATLTVENSGTGSLTNVRIVGITPLTHPATTILTTLPATIAATLAECASANGTFNFRPQGMAFGETTRLRVDVTADELGSQIRSVIVSVGSVETDTQNVASRTYNFDTDMSGWTTTAGTFLRVAGGAQATAFHVSSSQNLPDQCDVVRSPGLRLRAGSTLSLYNRYEIEPTDPVGGPYDRANVGVVDIQNGTRTPVIPSGGQLYTLANGTTGGTCGQGAQAGWNATSPGYPAFNQSTWNAGALNPGGIFTNRASYLEVRYGTDPGLHLLGFDFDEVLLTDFEDLVPDAQSNTCLTSPSWTFVLSGSGATEGGPPASATVRFNTPDGQPSTAATSVQIATANGTAVAGSDYTTFAATINAPLGTPNNATIAIPVTILNDTVPEPPETFTLNLSAPTGSVLGAIPIHTVTITDDDAQNFVKGDFNADGNTDILWRHDVSGENVVWFMNGANLVSGTFTTPSSLTDNNWKMVGTHDFNADLKTDILWRHAVSGGNVVWFMNGTTLTSGTFLTPATLADTNWKMAGTGDFDLDSRPDIVWHHQVSGEIVVWFMNGTTLATGTFTTPASLPDTGWQIVGVGDFNLDVRPDLLWRHQVSGENVVWFMNGTVLTSGTFTNPPALADTNWKMVATGDYTVPRDFKTDIVWRHAVSGQNVIWFMNGVTLTSGTFTNPSALADTNWKIVGPR